MKSLKAEALSGVKWNGIKNAVVAIVKVLQVAILTRFLTKEDFGLIGIALLFNAFSCIFVEMGFGTVVMHEQNMSKEKYASLYWANIVLGLLIAVVVSSLSSIIAGLYHREELKGVIKLTALMIFTGSISSLQKTVQQKNMNFRFLSILSIASSILVLVLNVIFASCHWGVYSMVWASLIGEIVISAIYLYVGIFIEHNIIFHFKLSEITQALKIGIYQMGSSILDFLAREMDSIIISSGLSLSFFGVYSLCKSLSMHIYTFINPIFTGVLTPLFAKIQSESSRIQAAYMRTLNLIGGVTSFFYGIVACAAVPILGILYGQSYTEYGFVLVCLCFYYLQQSMGNPEGSLIIAKGRTDLAFYWSIFRVVFVGSYLYVFSHFFDVDVFIVMLTVLPLFSQYPAYLISFKHLLDIPFFELLWVKIKPLVCILPILSLYLISYYVPNLLLSGLIIGVSFTLIYAAIYYIFRRDLLREIVLYGLELIHRKPMKTLE